VSCKEGFYLVLESGKGISAVLLAKEAEERALESPLCLSVADVARTDFTSEVLFEPPMNREDVYCYYTFGLSLF
jgi:hypothetical protein